MTAIVTAWKWAHIANKLENSGFGIGTKSVGSFPTSCGLHFANTSNGMLEIGKHATNEIRSHVEKILGL